MAWLKPKTDWKPTDYFNMTDYNRIKNNLDYLSNLANSLFVGLNLDGQILADATFLDRPSANKLNQLERRLDSLAKQTVAQDYGDMVVFVDFGISIRFDELNRIEAATLDIYDRLSNQASALPMLSFGLGKQNTPFRFK